MECYLEDLAVDVAPRSHEVIQGQIQALEGLDSDLSFVLILLHDVSV